MNKLAMALSFLVLLSFPAGAIDVSKEAPSANVEVAAPVCMDKASMYEWVKKNDRQLYTLTPDGQKKLREKVNMNRSRQGKELLTDQSEFFFIPGIDPMNTAVAYFDKGCAVDELTMRIASNMLAVVFQQAGILDAEIVKINDA